MLLEKEYSLVADSTISSSPQLDSNTLLHIHRPVRTYGRQRDNGSTNALDASSSSLVPSSVSRDSIHNTAPPGLSEEVPPSSPSHFSDCYTDTRGSPRSPIFEFAWKKGLRQLDEDDDLVLNTSFTSNPKDDASKLKSAIVPTAIDDADVFGGSQPSVDSHSPPHSVPAEAFRLSSPQVGMRTRIRRKPRIIHDSDSDSEPSKGSFSTTPASALHLLNTPHSGSSSTQPTSEDDIPAKVSTKRLSRRKMAPSSCVSVTPLAFTEDPSYKEIRGEETRKKTKIRVWCDVDSMVSLKKSNHSYRRRPKGIWWIRLKNEVDWLLNLRWLFQGTKKKLNLR